MNIDLFYGIFLGLIGTENMVLWGVYGDLLGEKFSLAKVWRSLVLGAVYGFILAYFASGIPLILIIFASIALERITTELYKALWRQESQLKYKIPSDFRLRFNIVYKRLIFVFLMSLVFYLLISGSFNVNKMLLVLLTGVFIALGGMLKDAPFEGFSPKKFLRSPIIALLAGTLLYGFFPEISSFILLLSIIGLERVCSEFYKKILHGRIPGKFKSITDRTWSKKREFLLPLYLANLIVIFLIFVISL